MTEGGEPPLPASLLGSSALETPVAVVSLPRVRENARRVASYAEAHGLGWRPHVKTHKSARIAEIQLAAGARGLTVATPMEAEVMARVTDDLLLAYPPVTSRTLERLTSLPEGIRLTVALDSAESLRRTVEAFRRSGRSVGVLVEVDLGMGRTGVLTPEAAVRLARKVRESEGARFEGILFYPGQIREAHPEQGDSIARLAEGLSVVIDRLAGAGLAPGTVSGGSSPTLWRSHELPGLTEIRPGTCIYNDQDMVSLGVAAPKACAYFILSTVVSIPSEARYVLDAGSKALTKEALRSRGEGFGQLLGREGDLLVSLSEEHGVVHAGGDRPRPRVGDRVLVRPNHVCVSVHLQDGIVAVDGEDWHWWPLDARGRGFFDAPTPTATTGS